MALGGHTLHMDLDRQKKSWQWRGAVCWGKSFNVPTKPYHGPGVWNDACLRRAYDHDGKFRKDYNPGIMGFLLSSRQAYDEGIHILYSANRISISSEPLLLHLPRLVPTEHLERITSLEILITAHVIQPSNARPFCTFDHLSPILDNVKTHCPHLRHLTLSIVPLYPVLILDGPTLLLIDAFHRSTRIRHMSVELPSDTYRYMARNCEEMEQHPYKKPVTPWGERALWRASDEVGGEARVQSRLVESVGYWLVEGGQGP